MFVLICFGLYLFDVYCYMIFQGNTTCQNNQQVGYYQDASKGVMFLSVTLNSLDATGGVLPRGGDWGNVLF